MADGDWYVQLTADAPAHLIVFPHAGAGWARFVRFARALRPDVCVWAASLPGRQARLAEPASHDLDFVVRELAERLAALSLRRYAMFGYCSGGLLALLVARAVRDHQAPAPTSLVIASFEAPDIGNRPREVAHLPTDRLWERLVADGGVTPDVSADVRLRQLVEPAVRADFTLLATYRYAPAEPLPCPIEVCFGTGDDTPRGAYLGWRRQSAVGARLRPLPGGHWLLDDACPELVSVVAGAVRAGAGS